MCLNSGRHELLWAIWRLCVLMAMAYLGTIAFPIADDLVNWIEKGPVRKEINGRGQISYQSATEADTPKTRRSLSDGLPAQAPK